MLNNIIKYFLNNRLITILLLIVVITWGLITAPFNWHQNLLPSDPVPVDAIPDIGDNQQIVATEWMGRSPKDIQEQITYPLTTSLLGIPGVKQSEAAPCSACHSSISYSRKMLSFIGADLEY